MGIHQDEGKSSFPKLHLAIICFINHFSIIINVPMATTFAIICTYKFSFFLKFYFIHFNFFTFDLLYSSKNVTMTPFFFAFLKFICWKPKGKVKMAKCSKRTTRCLHSAVSTEKASPIKDLFLFIWQNKNLVTRGPEGTKYPHLASSGSQLEHRNRFILSACGNSNI